MPSLADEVKDALDSKNFLMTLPNFTRLECQQIADRARTIADTQGLNVEWALVYRALEMAASTLDAFLARMELPLVIEKYAPAGDKTGVPQNPGMSSLFDWDETAQSADGPTA